MTINTPIRLLIANHVREFCYSFDYMQNYIENTQNCHGNSLLRYTPHPLSGHKKMWAVPK